MAPKTVADAVMRRAIVGQPLRVWDDELDDVIPGTVVQAYVAAGWPEYVVEVTHEFPAWGNRLAPSKETMQVRMDQGPYTDSGRFRVVEVLPMELPALPFDDDLIADPRDRSYFLTGALCAIMHADGKTASELQQLVRAHLDKLTDELGDTVMRASQAEADAELQVQLRDANDEAARILRDGSVNVPADSEAASHLHGVIERAHSALHVPEAH